MLKNLVTIWANIDRILLEESYLASVPDMEELWKHNLWFIGVINMVAWKYPMVHMKNIAL